MSATGTHSVFGGVILASALATQAIDMPTLAQSAWFFFGTGAVDFTSTLMRYGFPKDSPAPSSWSEADWDERIYEYVEGHSLWAWPYIFTHSLIGSIICLYTLFLLTGSEMVYWYGLGHLTHIMLDEVTHKRSYFFWPVPVRITSGNWYDDVFTKTQLSQRWERLTALSCIGHHAWLDDWGRVILGWIIWIY